MAVWNRFVNFLIDLYHDIVDWILLNRMIAIVSSVVLFCGGIALFVVFSGVSSEEELVEEIKSSRGDVSEVRHLFVSEDPDVEITDEFISHWLDKYAAQLLLSDNVKIVSPHTYVEDRGTLFKSYKIVVKPVYLTITADKPDRLLVNGEPVTISKDSKEHVYGPVLPDQYEIQAERKYPFATVKEKENVDALAGKTSVSLDLSGQEQSVIVDTDPGSGKYEGAKFFINGKPIQPRENSEGREFIGPLDPNQKYTIYAEWTYPWGTVRSDSEEVLLKKMELKRVILTPAIRGKLRKQLTDLFNTYAKQYVEAQKKKDGSVITVTTNDYSIFVPSDDETFQGELVQTAIDFSESYVDSVNPERIFLCASITYTYEITSRYHQTGKREKYSTEKYTLIYDRSSKKWLIKDSRSDSGDFSENNPEAVITKY